MADKYKAVWVSHSSMGDFLKCPRLYYLHNVYKNPKTGNKIALVSPHMSLGVAVHNVLEWLVNYKSEERPSVDFLAQYEEEWKKVSGKIGGFTSAEMELEFKERGKNMLLRVKENPGPLFKKTVNFYKGDMLPNFFLNGEEDNIILCGKVDWIEYVEETDSLRVIDFKTGKHDEKEGSLQFPIYHLLLNALQKRKVTSAAYWYIDRDDMPVQAELPSLEDSFNRVYEVAKKVKEAREKGEYLCPRGEEGCIHCRPYEDVRLGKAEYVGKGAYKQDLYII
jgi:ATP-dependent helicase/DNAse subunit B